MIKAGTFRSDLYYRIRVANIHIPPLRKRKDEIPLFLRFFIEHYSKEYDCPLENQPISENQMTALSGLEWKGNNQRDLQSVPADLSVGKQERTDRLIYPCPLHTSAYTKIPVHPSPYK